MRQQQRGFTLTEAMVALFLLFLTVVTVYGMLSTSDKGYAQATQVRMATHLAHQNLEAVEGGTYPKTVGTQTLPVSNLLVGSSPIKFNQALVITTQGTMVLVRSQVNWQVQSLKHQLEIKEYFTP